MKRRLGIVAIMALALVFTGVGGCAVTLTATDGAVTLAASTMEGEPFELATSEFNLIGRDGSGYLISAEGKLLKVDAEALSPLMDAVGRSAFANLPSLDTYTEAIGRGEGGEKVQALQQKLYDAGYLTGSVDGIYGGQTARAVSALQEAGGLPVTGEADAATQMLLDSASIKPIAFSAAAVNGGRFDRITENTDVDLTGAVERNLTLEFDDISGEGVIANDNLVTYSVDAPADIDRCDFTFRFVIAVRQNNDGSYALEPALLVSSVSVRRPIVQKVTLKSGSQRFTFGVSDLDSVLSGLKSRETGRVLLDKDAAAMLAQAAKNGELRLRVNCRYDTFDIDVPADQLQKIADVGYAAQGL